MKNKKIPTNWFIALVVASLIGFTFSHLLWRIVGSEVEAVVRFLGAFVGFRPTFHVKMSPGDAPALKCGFWIVFTILFSNYLLRWVFESSEWCRDFGKKMYRWVSKPLVFWLLLGVLAPYAVDLLQRMIGFIVWAFSGKTSDSWRVVGPFLEHRFGFTFDGAWETFWLWLDGPPSPTTQHFADELRRTL